VHRHGAQQHHERHGARFVADLNDPILAGLARVLARAVDEVHGVSMGCVEPGQFDTVSVAHRILARDNMKIVARHDPPRLTD
jgi:hypothetical protein